MRWHSGHSVRHCTSLMGAPLRLTWSIVPALSYLCPSNSKAVSILVFCMPMLWR